MSTLPTNNIDITQARFPVRYEQAKVALAACDQIDECQHWADKAEVLASYAKMADDDSLRDMADRIKARAVRRMGELLKQFDAQGRRSDQQLPDGTVQKLSQHEAAETAGISERQAKTAVRVANIPTDEFETAVESEKPPTVTKLAAMGKKPRTVKDDDGADRIKQTVRRFCEPLHELHGRLSDLSADSAVIELLLARQKKDKAFRQRIADVVSGLTDLVAKIDGPAKREKSTTAVAQEQAPPTVPEQPEPSGTTTLEWFKALGVKDSHLADAAGGATYAVTPYSSNGVFSHYITRFKLPHRDWSDAKVLGSAKSLETAKEIARQHAGQAKAETA